VDLRRAALSGIRWIAAGRVVAELAGLASTIALARLIAPDEYGRGVIAVAVAVVVSGLFQEGLVAPLVQARELGERHLRTTMLSALVLGAVLALALLLALPWALRPALGDDAADLIRPLAAIPLLEALAVVPRARLERALSFRRLGILEGAGTMISIGTAVALAALGLGARAIVLGALAQSAVQTVLLLAGGGRLPAPRWHATELGALLHFSVPAALSSLLYQASRNIDYVLVGARLGAREAGFFWRAYTLAFDYQGKVSGIMLRLAFPLYSRAESPEHMHRMRARIVRVHATVLFPALMALVAMAPTLVPFVYGDRWEPAVVPTQLLAFGGLFAVIGTGTGPVLLASGHPRALLGWNAANFVVYAALVFFMAPFGLTAVAVGVVGYGALSFVALHVLLHRVVGLAPRALLADVVPATASSAVMLAASLATAGVLRSVGTPAVLELAGTAAVGFAVYALVLRAGFPTAWRDAALVATSVIRRAQPG
jgi:lipopolysaccharide exporter